LRRFVIADRPVLTVVVCGAGPASKVSQLVSMAQEPGWAIQLIATPSALAFLDLDVLEALTGSPIRSQYRKPGVPRSSRSDAIVVAPATYNTINKWAQGISDTYALGVLAETTGLKVPTVVLPFVNSALAMRVPFQRSVADLRREGVTILLGPEGVQPHEPHTGDALIESFPWHLALAALEDLAFCRAEPQAPPPSRKRSLRTIRGYPRVIREISVGLYASGHDTADLPAVLICTSA
jgi:hypothetical protein